jgi:hypothetical protein
MRIVLKYKMFNDSTVHKNITLKDFQRDSQSKAEKSVS